MAEVRTPDGDFATFVAGEYNLTPPTLNDQDTAELQLTNKGELKIALGSGGNLVGVDNPNGTIPQTRVAIDVVSFGYLYNPVAATWDNARTPTTFKPIAAVAVTAATPVAVWTPAASKKFRLMGFMLSLSVAGSVILKDAATEIARTPLMAAGAGLASPPMGNGVLSALANNVLNIDVTATGSVSGFVFGTEE